MMRRRSSFVLSLAVLIALLLGALISALLFTALRRLEHDKVDINFQQQAKVRVAAVQHGLDSSIEVLLDVNQLFVTFDSVSRKEFQQFTQPLLERNPYLQAFNYHRIISAAERLQYEAAMREHSPNFTIGNIENGDPVPDREREQYRVVEYIEPMQSNAAALGVNADSYTFQHAAMRRAIDTGKPSATGLLKLTQEQGSQKGIIVLMPIYRKGAQLTDIAARRRAVMGDTAAVFRSSDLIAESLAADKLLLVSNTTPDINISVYASATASEADLVFRKGVPVDHISSYFGFPAWLFYDQPAPYQSVFEVAGQSWQMEVSTPPISFLNSGGSALWVLIAGLFFSVGGAAYLQGMENRSRRIQALVDERTLQLRAANEDLIADIAARKRTENELKLRQRAIEASANAIIITSSQVPDYPIEYVNPAFERITGYSSEEAIGRNLCFLWGADLDQSGIEEMRATINAAREGHAVLRNYRKDGSMFWSDFYIAPVKDDANIVSHFIVVQYDITAAKRYEAELEFQTNRDALTGLANRNLLSDRLDQAISYAHRYDYKIWVLFVDLDRFKFVNDTLGHQAGDTLLKAVAARLQSVVRDTDTVARIGGDEFVLVLPERNDVGLKTYIVQRIMETIAQPMTIEGHEFFISGSIGVAVYPADGETPEDLIKHADIAMYRAKETGRNNFQFYTPAMNEHALERLRLEGDLRNALEREEFVLHYQPQLDLYSGEIVGVEALIRWQHPEQGLLPLTHFIDLAEETGLIVPIGAWVIRTACLQSKAWQLAGLGYLRMAINLSLRQFSQQGLVASLAEILHETELAPECLEIKLTESMLIEDADHVINTLRDLKALGVRLSINDFGAGYSGFAALKRFPIDFLKIDRSFINDIASGAEGAAIVASIISLAHNLRLQVIAEGVETVEQLAYLYEHNCDLVQGDFFSEPVIAELLPAMLREQKILRFPISAFK